MTDRKRLMFVWGFVQRALESDSALLQITLLCGDAPLDCNCREAACPHERQFPPSIWEVRETIDAAIRASSPSTQRYLAMVAPEPAEKENP